MQKHMNLLSSLCPAVHLLQLVPRKQPVHGAVPPSPRSCVAHCHMLLLAQKSCGEGEKSLPPMLSPVMRTWWLHSWTSSAQELNRVILWSAWGWVIAEIKLGVSHTLCIHLKHMSHSPLRGLELFKLECPSYLLTSWFSLRPFYWALQAGLTEMERFEAFHVISEHGWL